MLTTLHDISERIPQRFFADAVHRFLPHPGATGHQSFAEVSLDGDGKVVNAREIDLNDFKARRILRLNNHVAAGVVKLSKILEAKSPQKAIEKLVMNPATVVLEKLDGIQHPMTLLLASVLKRNDSSAFLDELRESVFSLFDKDKLSSIAVILENHVPVSEEQADNLLHTEASYRSLSDHLRRSELVPGDFVDMFGRKGAMFDEPWRPHVASNVPGLAAFQSNPNTPAYANYGINGQKKVPVTIASAQIIDNTLQTLLSPKCRGTLCDVRRFSGSTLIQFVVPMLGKNPVHQETEEMGWLFGGEEDNLDVVLERGRTIIAAMRADATKSPDTEFAMMSILKQGNSAPCIMANWQFGIDFLRQRLEVYLAALADIEKKNFYGKQGVFESEKAIRLNQMSTILNRKWTIGAGLDSENHFVKNYSDNILGHRFAPHEAIDAWLWGRSEWAARALDHCGRYHSHLIIDIANRRQRGEYLGLRGCRADLLHLRTMFSLLYRLKGTTMTDIQNSAPYLMGLAMAYGNQIHIAYRRAKRLNLPAKLVGSAALRKMQNGRRVLWGWRCYQKRMRFFAEWAKKEIIANKDKDTPHLRQLRHALKEHKDAIGALADVGETPNKFTNEQWLAFSLGYYRV